MNGQSLRMYSGILFRLLLVFTIISVSSCAAINSTGWDLDPSFNPPNAYVLWHTPDASQDRALEMAIQQDGKILLGGYTNDTKQKDIQIRRYLPNGSLDTDFGKEGQVTYSGGAGKDDYAFGITVDADNNILVSGREHNGHDSDILLLRCNPDGSPDPSFGNNGTVRYAGPGSGTDSGRGVVVQQDGKIVVCGEVNTSSQKELAVLRFNPDGTPDTGFASSGIFTLGNQGGRESYGFGLTLDSKERIVVTGSIYMNGIGRVGLIRLLGNGSVDTNFGSSGVVTWNSSENGPDYGNWVSVTQDDKILVTGVETDDTGSFDILLLKYNPDGSLDSSFGDNGIVRFTKSGYDYAWGQTSMPDGRIIVAGTTRVNGLETPVLIGLTKDGKTDTSFGENGIKTFETIGIGPLYAVHVNKEGKILASGYITEDNGDMGLLFCLTVL